MNNIEKQALDSLSELYYLGEKLIKSPLHKVDYGIKYTELRDDLKESIQKRRVKQE